MEIRDIAPGSGDEYRRDKNGYLGCILFLALGLYFISG
jgi:hypothetical protein